MPIDPSKALGAPIAGGTASWNKDKVILYHLGIGAGVPQTDPNELAYCYERDLKVLPSFGVIPAFGAMGGLGAVPGLQFNPAMLLHGEQDLEIHAPIPIEAAVESSGQSRRPLRQGPGRPRGRSNSPRRSPRRPRRSSRTAFRSSSAARAASAAIAARRRGNIPPERTPDHVVESKTLPQQALLYRLTGDKNPLHADPAFAKMGGFDRPSCTVSAPTASSARQQWTRRSAVIRRRWRATRRASPASFSPAKRSSPRSGARARPSSSMRKRRNAGAR